MRAFTFIVGALVILLASNGKLIKLIDALRASAPSTTGGGGGGTSGFG